MTYRTPLTLLFAAGLALGGQARAEGPCTSPTGRTTTRRSY